MDNNFQAKPLDNRHRYSELDALRGFLLFFILLANLPSFSGFYFMGREGAEALFTNNFDHWFFPLQEVLIHGKFYSLFALLFGIGFAVILSRLSAKSNRGLAIYKRRLAVLGLFGLTHMLIWSGDILLPYALCGFLLILFKDVSDKRLLQTSFILIVLPVLYYLLAFVSNGLTDLGSYLGQPLMNYLESNPASQQGPFPIYQSGTIEEVLKANLVGFAFRWVDLIDEGRLFKILGVFLIGYWAGRKLLSNSLLKNTQLLKKVLIIGLVIGLPANIGMAIAVKSGGAWPTSWLGVVQYSLYAIGVVPLALAYGSGFLLMLTKEWGNKILGIFAPLGRMALTNYLMHTIISVLFFYGIGFGYLGTFTPTDWLLYALVVTALQIVFSVFWLKHFTYGPLEWLWRGLTYGFKKLNPITKPAEA